MRRHTIPARDPNLTIVVGWDNPLATYFAQVARPEDPDREDDDPILLWVGATPCQATRQTAPPYFLTTQCYRASQCRR